MDGWTDGSGSGRTKKVPSLKRGCWGNAKSNAAFHRCTFVVFFALFVFFIFIFFRRLLGIVNNGKRNEWWWKTFPPKRRQIETWPLNKMGCRWSDQVEDGKQTIFTPRRDLLLRLEGRKDPFLIRNHEHERWGRQMGQRRHPSRPPRKKRDDRVRCSCACELWSVRSEATTGKTFSKTAQRDHYRPPPPRERDEHEQIRRRGKKRSFATKTEEGDAKIDQIPAMKRRLLPLLLPRGRAAKRSDAAAELNLALNDDECVGRINAICFSAHPRQKILSTSSEKEEGGKIGSFIASSPISTFFSSSG